MAAAKAPDADEVLAERLREVREGKGWSQQRLADELVKLGWETDRTTVAKIENRGRRVTVADAFTLAAALGCAPLNLFSPLRSDVRVRVAPKLIETARRVRYWVIGRQALRDEDSRTYYTEVPEEEWMKRQRSDLSMLLSSAQELADAWGESNKDAAIAAIDRMNLVLSRKDQFLQDFDGR